MIQDWDRLRIFHSVAVAGSFTRAGRDLGMSQSAISRQISALEAQLDINLFHRHARGLILTEQGEILHRTVKEILLKLRNTEAQITDNEEQPSGLLRVTTTYGLGGAWVAMVLPEFRKQYPDISVSLILDDGGIDFSLRDADVALRILPPRSGGNLIRRHLMHIRLALYAHKDYLAARGHPVTLADLEQHDLLGFPQEGHHPVENVNWHLEVGMPAGEQRQTLLRVNSYQTLLDLVLAKHGIASIPDYMASMYRDLEEVRLEGAEAPSMEIFFAYAEAVRHSAKMIAFRDFLLSALTQRKVITLPSQRV